MPESSPANASAPLPTWPSSKHMPAVLRKKSHYDTKVTRKPCEKHLLFNPSLLHHPPFESLPYFVDVTVYIKLEGMQRFCFDNVFGYHRARSCVFGHVRDRTVNCPQGNGPHFIRTMFNLNLF